MEKRLACLTSICTASTTVSSTVSSLTKLCIAFALSVQMGSLKAAPPPDFTLASNTWEQLSIPGDSTGLSIESLFGDDLPASQYNNSWVIALWDAVSQRYINPGLSGSIPTGHGFWMLQTTGAPVTLDVTDIGSAPPAL